MFDVVLFPNAETRSAMTRLGVPLYRVHRNVWMAAWSTIEPEKTSMTVGLRLFSQGMLCVEAVDRVRRLMQASIPHSQIDDDVFWTFARGGLDNLADILRPLGWLVRVQRPFPDLATLVPPEAITSTLTFDCPEVGTPEELATMQRHLDLTTRVEAISALTKWWPTTGAVLLYYGDGVNPSLTPIGRLSGWFMYHDHSSGQGIAGFQTSCHAYDFDDPGTVGALAGAIRRVARDPYLHAVPSVLIEGRVRWSLFTRHGNRPTAVGKSHASEAEAWIAYAEQG